MMEEHLAEIIVWGVEDQCNKRLKMIPEGDQVVLFQIWHCTWLQCIFHSESGVAMTEERDRGEVSVL